MAYSPSPGPATMTVPGPTTQPRRLSASPPPSQPISKRDKKRNAIDQRIKDLEASFRANREAHSRTQLSTLARDISYINSANPYGDKPLEDGVEGFGNIEAVGITQTDVEGRPVFGKWAAKFVEEVNDAMEERDTNLTILETTFRKRLEALQEEFDFTDMVALQEHRALKESARTIMVASVQEKKKRLQREKDALDTADSATLINKEHFNTIQPGSPGGPQSNRKTRNTRHRLEPDYIEVNGETHKKKRKAPIDEYGSPGPTYKTVAGVESILLSEKGLTHPEHYAFEKAFPAKDLNALTKSAIEATHQFWTNKRSKTHQQNGKGINGLSSVTNGDVSDTEGKLIGQMNISDGEGGHEDMAMLVAPMMDRTGSHATRSTRVAKEEGPPLYEILEQGREDTIPHFSRATVSAHLRLIRHKEDVPPTTSLLIHEQLEDLAVFESAITSGRY